MLRTVIYARYSSEKQNEQSIEGQIHECQQYAESHDMVIVNQYIDRALSGKTDDRPAFLKMIKDSGSGIFDAVLVYKTDRFARNRYDSAVYKSKLKKNGVKIFYAKENIPDGPEGVILEALLEGMAEYYSSELSQKVKRGIRENVKKGLSFGGACPFGYKIVDKRYTIDETQAPYVKKIFEEYAAGRPAVEIFRDLNEAPNFAGKGHRWNRSSLNGIIRNKKYIGIYELEDITVTDAIPSIISPEVFKKAQERAAFNRHHKTASHINYLLSGKLFCGICGSAMTGRSGTGKSGLRYYYYVCKNGKCHQHKFRVETLEKQIISSTIRHILNPSKFHEIARHCLALYKRDIENDGELLALYRQHKEVEEKHANIIKAIEAGIITAGIKQRLAELESMQAQIAMDIKRQQASHCINLTEDHIIYLLRYFYERRDDKAFFSNIIDGFIYKIYVYEKVMVVTYNLADSAKKLIKSEIDAMSMSSCRDVNGSPLESTRHY